MERRFLSIIIPVYNGELYLRDTIESILKQPCKDFELLLLDDGSSDNSLSVCKKYEKENVRVFTHKNMGVSATRNKGIELSKGEFVIFCDQDDSFRANFYTDEMRDLLASKQFKDIELIVCGAWWGDAYLKFGKFRSIHEFIKEGVYDGRNDDLAWNKMYTFNMNIYSRKLFWEHDGKPSPIRFFNLPLDVETTFRHMTLYGARKIMFSDKFSFCVRRNNEASVSSNWDWLKVYSVKMDAYFSMIEWHKKNFSSDLKSIGSSEKEFLKVTNEFVKMNILQDKCVSEIVDILKKKYYYNYLQSFLDRYPLEGTLLNAVLFHPHDLPSKNKKSFLHSLHKKISSVYYKYFYREKKIDLRVEIL